MRRFILIVLMLLCRVPTTGTVGASPENATLQLLAIEHDDLTDPRTGQRLQGPEVWVPQYDEKLLSGGTLYVSVPECGIDGHARVLSIGECPQVSPRPGPEFQVVTATFHHHGASIIDVGVSGLADTIGATPNHPFWSEDKQDFVRADELRVGEQLRKTDGSLTSVTSLVPRAGLHDVFNLEVQVEHTYHVSASGVLVHNGTLDDCVKVVNPKTIMFSQRSVGKSVIKMVTDAETGKWTWRNRGLYGKGDNVLKVIRQADGSLVTLDNRRLLMGRLTGQSVRIRIVDPSGLKDLAGKKTFQIDLIEKLDGMKPTFQLPGIEL